jgi:hypothetical protein
MTPAEKDVAISAVMASHGDDHLHVRGRIKELRQVTLLLVMVQTSSRRWRTPPRCTAAGGEEERPMKRNPDGTFRGNRSPSRITERMLIARWVETEVIRLKRMGIVSFETIADLLTQAGRGESVPVTLPQGVNFPPNYRISKMACSKAYRRRMEKEPNLAAAEHRRLDTERCEELYLALQPGIRKGDPRSIDAAVKVLGHKAEINGLKAPARVEMTGKDGGPMTIETFRALCAEVENEGKPSADEE